MLLSIESFRLHPIEIFHLSPFKTFTGTESWRTGELDAIPGLIKAYKEPDDTTFIMTPGFAVDDDPVTSNLRSD